RLSLVEHAAKEMEQLIQEGHWQVGDKIRPEKELMEQFEVSRNTLREALSAVTHVGLLETKQGRGTLGMSERLFDVVLSNQIEQNSVIQILEVRLAIEREAAFLAAQRRSEEDLQVMERFIYECQEALNKKELDSFIKADVKLHEKIVQA